MISKMSIRVKQNENKPVVAAIIPARLASTRLPRKMLRSVAGRPLLAWTVEAAQRCSQLDRIVVAVDSDEVARLCQDEGWEWRMTSPDLPTGTDRMHSVSAEVDADIYVNIQGDEPLLQPAHIDALLRPFTFGDHVDVTTVKTRCPEHDIANPNGVKVVTAADGRALYFSRATVPYDRDAMGGVEYWKHIGLYAYRRAALQRFPTLPVSKLERWERLEQLRLLENGLSIYVAEVTAETVGVDTEEDLERVEQLLRKQ